MLKLNQDVWRCKINCSFCAEKIKLKEIMFSELLNDFTSSNTISIPNKCIKICRHDYSWRCLSSNWFYLMDSPAEQSQIRRKRSAAHTSVIPELHLQWPLQGEKFIITLEEDGWNLGLVQSYNQEQNIILCKRWYRENNGST